MRFLQSKKLISLFFLVIFSFYALFQSYASVSDIKYPTNEWHVSTPEEQGMQSKTLLDMMEVIKDQKYNIHSVTIVRNGSLVLDSYLYPFKNGKGHEMYSATKSVTSAIMGIAIDKGHIKDVHQPITQFFPNKKISNPDELKRSLTLKDLLVVPEKNLVAVFTSNIEEQNMYISGRLLREYIIPDVVSSEPLPSDPHEKARLDDVLASIAKAPA